MRATILLLIGLLSLTSASAQEGPSVEELRAQVEAEPDNGANWYMLGRALQSSGDDQSALEAFDRAIELKFQVGGAHMRSAQILAAGGDVEAAVGRLEQAVAVEPMALSFLPQIGGIPALEGDPRLEAVMARAEEARYPCRTRPESRQFDFWIGEWTVTNPQGQQAGTNVITEDLAGCVIRESWTDAYGGHGTSVNFYESATEKWHQVWTSDNGTVTHYEGEWRDGAMRFHAVGFGEADGQTRHRRMTFTPNPDGSVRQLIEVSQDGSEWTVGFDGRYGRQSADD